MVMNGLAHTILLALWFFLPAGAANAAPILVARLPVVHRAGAPLDFDLHVGGERLLGSHKTWRGLVAGVLAATVVFWLQQRAVEHSAFLTSIVNDTWTFTLLPVWLLGPFLGLGALGGDAVESFLKRRNGIKAGESWFPYDQVDYIAGAAALSTLIIMPPLAVYIAALLLWAGIHLVAGFVGYRVGLKERPL